MRTAESQNHAERLGRAQQDALPGLEPATAAGAASPGTSPRAVVLLGAPGTGKSTELVRRALEFSEDGKRAGEVLILAPTRLAADRLRDAFSLRAEATVSTPPARAWHSYAFDLLRRAHAEGLLPGVHVEPRLLAGPEQDVLIGEMLSAHAEGIGRVPAWPEDLHEALGTRGIRRELREFLDRCAEFGLSPQDVRDLGEALDRPEWIAASDFREEYEQLRRLRMPQAFDPSALVHEAAGFLEDHPEFLARERERLRMVLVDDLQEATPAVLHLLRVLGSDRAGRAPELVMSVCTDVAVQGFRGARPEDLRGLDEQLTGYPEIETVRLDEQHRSRPEIAAAVARIGSRIPPVAGLRHRRETAPVAQATDRDGADDATASGDLPGTGPAVSVQTVVSEQHELRLISQLILEEHVRAGRDLGDMAVLVRNGSSLSRIKRHLDAEGIPAVVPVAETPLREEPAVRPFLDALWLATDPASADADRLRSLLTSRLGGASPSTLRRMRQSLRAQELRSGGTRGGDQLILDALTSSGTETASDDVRPAVRIQGPGTQPLHRVRRVLEAARDLLAEDRTTADQALWALWEASGLAETWAEESRGRGAAAERAHRDLDAMVALFKAAERYVDQQPGAGPREFLEYLDSQDLPMDTLAPRAAARSAVSLGTPATAAGREWGWVLVAGLQQNVWPNTTVRGGLLRTPELVDAVLLGPEQAARVTHRDRVAETRWDELRQFAAACSRAGEQLILTAAQNEEDVPSEFLDLVEPGVERRDPVAVRRPMTLRGLTAELRARAQDPSDPDLAETAAEQLAVLAEGRGEPVPGAHPEQWWGLLPLSSEAGALEGQERIPLSPSRLEAITRSPLDWFVAVSGAEAGTDAARSLGTLVHEIAQNHPEIPPETTTEDFVAELVAELEQKFSALGLGETWQAEAERDRAVGMLERYAEYLRSAGITGRREVAGVETAFQVLVPGLARDALLTGRVDRLEVDARGQYVIIDLKTGRHAPAEAEIPAHPQLAGYQVALAAGAGPAMAAEYAGHRPQESDAGQESDAARGSVPAPDEAAPAEPLVLGEASVQELSGGAVLVQLGLVRKTVKQQVQEPLGEDPEWAVELVQRCADLISRHRIQARHSARNPYGCKLPDLCPICSRGRQITQP